MGRTVLLALLPALLIATGWDSLEEPTHGGALIVAAAFAVLAGAVPSRRLRIPAVLAAALAVVSIAFETSPFAARPFDGDHDFFGPVLGGFGGGVVDFYEVSLPFDPGEQALMHGVIVVAVFAFTLLATLAIAASRPILAAGATFAGTAWPVTLVPQSATPLRGLLLLATALVLLAGLRPGARRGGGQAMLVGTAISVAALVAVSSPSVAKGGFLDWKHWDYTRPAKPVSVQYAWDANYDGIDFPRKATTVFKVDAPRRTPYWRATTLDVFLDDHWREETSLIEPVRGAGLDRLVNDPLLPPRARDAENWLKQDVRIAALDDTHLVGASVPVAFEQGRAGSFGSGIGYVGRLERGEKYSVWSYEAQPTPAQLTRSRPEYPVELLVDSPFLVVGNLARVPPFGTPGREAAMDQLFRERGLSAYRPLYRQARRVVGQPRNPYAAAVALEAWFRSSGVFRYDEHPPRGGDAPPLVAFVTGHRRGYCQHFAGAMALMLRYLGIPARVAAGFTNGRFDQEKGEWTVSDTNAHAWVEVWFRGYGWLPFDPTPGRGRLRAQYTASSLFFDADGATEAFGGVAATAALGLVTLRNQLGGASSSPDDRPRGPDSGFQRGTFRGVGAAQESNDRGDPRLLGLLLVGLGGVVAAFWLGKSARRGLRYRSRDPRSVAAAVRAELVDYLTDQGVAVQPSATPAELGRSVRERFRVDTEPLAQALGAARFGPAGDAERAASTARRELRGVLKAIRSRLGATRRLRGLVSLRSLGLRSA
ncbi:MAG TPA: transglutaminaseTgpA domain-containing protein [Gaiellaceae bacterium]|nr:transglutaminaseTgpA domain-containing protein [Gaiellaceae bacterium]